MGNNSLLAFTAAVSPLNQIVNLPRGHGDIHTDMSKQFAKEKEQRSSRHLIDTGGV